MTKRRFFIISMLGVILFWGMAMNPEARRSFEAFEQRAESGDPEAQYRLSALLEKGFDSIPADTVRSLSLLRRSAASGYAPARNYLGYLFGEGKLLPANPDSAMYWIGLAAEDGDLRAAQNLAYMLLERRDAAADSIALHWLRRASAGELPQADVTLADLLAEGRIVPRDSLQAVALYRRALSKGFRDAEPKLLNLIGPSFSTLGSCALLQSALDYYSLGANGIAAEALLHIAPGEAETAQAYALLGHSYSRGLGVPYDHRRANEYFARAAMLGNPSAQFVLSETLEIFPDALDGLLEGSSDSEWMLNEDVTAESLREAAASAGIDTPEKAVERLFTSPE